MGKVVLTFQNKNLFALKISILIFADSYNSKKHTLNRKCSKFHNAFPAAAEAICN